MNAILSALIKAIPGVVALIELFSKKRDAEPSAKEIADKSASEMEELEKWKRGE